MRCEPASVLCVLPPRFFITSLHYFTTSLFFTLLGVEAVTSPVRTLLAPSVGVTIFLRRHRRHLPLLKALSVPVPIASAQAVILIKAAKKVNTTYVFLKIFNKWKVVVLVRQQWPHPD